MFGLLKYAKNYRKQIILGPVFKFLEACFELVLPLFMAHLVDVGIRQNDRQTVIEMALWMLVMSLVGLFFVMICQYYASVASQGFGTELRNQLMKKINQLSHKELNRYRYPHHSDHKRYQPASIGFSDVYSVGHSDTFFKYWFCGHGFLH